MSAPGRGSGSSSASTDELPRIDFATFVVSLAHSARVHLGDAPDPSGVTFPPDLELARQSIDILGLMEDKTRGNLTGAEERVLSDVLHDLRLRFVEVGKTR